MYKIIKMIKSNNKKIFLDKIKIYNKYNLRINLMDKTNRAQIVFKITFSDHKILIYRKINL